MPITEASVPATEVRTIKSNQVDQEYRISIALPYSYPADPKKTYSTVYLLDANLYFGLVTETTRVMYLCETFPETIIVGIGYPVDEPLAEAYRRVVALRARDLTPVVDREAERRNEPEAGVPITTGGASRFLAFIETELIPMIESEYRSNPADRTLVGHSFGGLFVLYALFHRAGLYRRYLAASPILDYGDRVTFNYESTFADNHKALPVSVYLGIGDGEDLPGRPLVGVFHQFVARIADRKYGGLVLTSRIFPNCDHCAAVAPTFQAGLSALLA